MLRFIKAQASSIIASLIDFLITFIAVHFLSVPYISASVAGSILGAASNFFINRNWVFNAERQALKGQMLKYLLVWLGNLALITAGVYLLTHFLQLNYLFAKILVSVFMGLSYSYIMQKQFIFSVNES